MKIFAPDWCFGKLPTFNENGLTSAEGDESLVVHKNFSICLFIVIIVSLLRIFGGLFASVSIVFAGVSFSRVKKGSSLTVKNIQMKWKRRKIMVFGYIGIGREGLRECFLRGIYLVIRNFVLVVMQI